MLLNDDYCLTGTAEIPKEILRDDQLPQDDLSIHIQRLLAVNLDRMTDDQKRHLIAEINLMLGIKPIRKKRVDLGKAKKFNGVWLLGEFGFEDFELRGKHPAEVHLGDGTYLDLMNGDVCRYE